MVGMSSVARHTKGAGKFTALIVGMIVALAALVPMRVAHADVTYSGALNCDANAVIYCGATSGTQLVTKYNNGDGINSAASIHDIFTYFGISSAAVQAIPTTAVIGSVTRSGDVFVGTDKVATGAITGGRQNMPGSTQVTSGGTTFFVRPPSVSFVSSPSAAYVVMNANHEFQFAVLASCGNAVKATPVAPTPTPTPPPPTPTPTTPNYTIQKTVAQHGSTNFGSEIEAQPNTDVDYKIVINSTGTADVSGLMVKDTLPSDDTYVTGTLMRDGKAVADTDVSSFFGGGLTIGILAHGTSTTFTFEALAGANQNNDNCNPETLPNVSSMSATNLPTENATATVSVVCAPKMTTTVIVSQPAPPTTATQTAAPAVLPATGAASVAGIFTGTVLAGSAGYHWFMRRRLSR